MEVIIKKGQFYRLDQDIICLTFPSRKYFVIIIKIVTLSCYGTFYYIDKSVLVENWPLAKFI